MQNIPPQTGARPAQRPEPLRRLAAIALCLTLAACAHTPLERAVPPPLDGHGPVTAAPDEDVLRVTEGMRDFVRRYVPADQNQRLQLDLLMLALRDKGVLGFHYNEEQTLTAEEAFRRRAGNCIAFANLFIALAREVGLDVRYQEVSIEPEWTSRGDLLLQAKHVNVLAQNRGYAFMIDVSGEKVSMDLPRRVMDDDEARGMYFNNLAAESLVAGDFAGAYAHFLRAIEIAPGLADAWSNLGVLFGRNGQFRDAEFAYQRALALNPREMAAMGNLHDLYLEQGRVEEAEQLARRVERHRRDNPYYLLGLAEEQIEAGDLARAEQWLREALDMKEREHRFHFALARVHYLAGREQAASRSLQRARELAPPEFVRRYRRPLEELVFSDPRALAADGLR